MKFFCKIFTIVLLFGSVASIPTHAEADTYNWYCKHVKDHVQPQVDPSLAFVEELGGYYIDHKHILPDDVEKVVYLTFDAGYENGNVAKILDILKDESVPAAFFILEGLIRHEPELVKRMAEEGHLVCNHTAHHRDMSQMDDTAFLAELRALEASYTELTGESLSPYYRPPEGKFSRQNLACAKENGYQTVFWSFAYPDWDNDSQMSEARAKQIISENLHNGAVLLLHPTSATNAAVLQALICEMKVQGYRFGTLDELTAEAS